MHLLITPYSSLITMESIIQAYANTPRRKQIKILGGFFLGLLVLVVLLISYLVISASVVSTGRELQVTKNDIDDLEYGNVTLQEKIASLTTLTETRHQAQEQGFRPAQPSEVLFVVVPGFRRSFNAPVHIHEETKKLTVDLNKPAYHQTLLNWMGQELVVFSDVFEGSEP